MPAYKTPGVFVEEISTLPPSGSRGLNRHSGLYWLHRKGPKIARVSTLRPSTNSSSGGPKSALFSCGQQQQRRGDQRNSHAVGQCPGRLGARVPDVLRAQPLLPKRRRRLLHRLGRRLQHDHVEGTTSARASPCFEQEDEPTLIVLTDAVNLATADYHELAQAALASELHKLGDRFALTRCGAGAVADTADPTAFRDGIGTNYLAYGAAYYPYLETTLTFAYAGSGVTIQIPATDGTATTTEVTLDSIKSTKTSLYNAVKSQLSAQRVVLPPSAAVAGGLRQRRPRPRRMEGARQRQRLRRHRPRRQDQQRCPGRPQRRSDRRQVGERHPRLHRQGHP